LEVALKGCSVRRSVRTNALESESQFQITHRFRL
jgi:hypothetical protein